MRYPTTKSGLAVPVQEVGFEVVQHQRRVTNRHHLQFERHSYASPLERVFRGLYSRVVDMRIIDHNELHERFSAPRMPKEVAMIDCVEEYLATYGVIDVVREKRTCEIYQIEAGTWQNIKGQYGSGNGIQEVYATGNSVPYQLPR